MKIQFITHYSSLYGANRSLLTLIRYFHQNGYDIRVLLPGKGTLSKQLEKEGIHCDFFPYYASFLYIRPKLIHILVPLLQVFDFLMFPFLVFKLSFFKPDLIYSNTSAENLGVFIAKILGSKHVCHIREFMSLDYDSYFILGPKLKARFIKWSDGAIFVSQAVRRYVMRDEQIQTNHKVIYNGLSAPVDILLEKEIPAQLNFGIVGLIDPGKGHLKAVEYFANLLQKYPDALLNIYGGGSAKYIKKLENKIKDLQIGQNVVLHGYKSDVNDIYSFDILLMFSKAEGFGRVTIEAIMRGIPVIGFDNAGTSELIESTKTGFLFDDYLSFAQGIKSLLRSKAYFNQVRFDAFDKSIKEYNQEMYCINVEKFIGSIFSNQGV